MNISPTADTTLSLGIPRALAGATAWLHQLSLNDTHDSGACLSGILTRHPPQGESLYSKQKQWTLWTLSATARRLRKEAADS